MSNLSIVPSQLLLSLVEAPAQFPETAIQAFNTYVQSNTPQQVIQSLGEIRTEVLSGLLTYGQLSDRTLLILTTEIQRRNNEHIRNEFQRVDGLIADCAAKETCLTNNLELLKQKQQELGKKVDLVVL